MWAAESVNFHRRQSMPVGDGIMRVDRSRALKKAASFLMTSGLHYYHTFSKPPSPVPFSAVSFRCAIYYSSDASVAMTDAAMLQQKRALRSQIRRDLKSFSPAQRSHEDLTIQSVVINSSWFKSSQGLCAYISCEALREVDTSKIVGEVLKNTDAGKAGKRLYVPRIEDKNSHMRMLRISTIEDLIANSMNILEPSPIDSEQNERENVMLANQPVDLFLLPGLAFDKNGSRLGRGGGYYDSFLRKYEELANQKNWEHPLRVALAYSVQIVEDNTIPMTPTDVSVDALVTADGVIPISSAALERL